MGILKKLLIEEIPIEAAEELVKETEEFYDEKIERETVVENISQNNTISDIYNSNGLSDFTKSIFKVEELLKSLPKEMPDDTKRQVVLAILASFNLSSDMVVQDGIERCKTILSALEKITITNENFILSNNGEIEQRKIEIQDYEKDNASRREIIETTRTTIELENKRITNLIKFIEGE